jgi:hypothetical protein
MAEWVFLFFFFNECQRLGYEVCGLDELLFYQGHFILTKRLFVDVIYFKTDTKQAFGGCFSQ